LEEVFAILILVCVVLGLACLVLGIVLLVRFFKTEEKRFLWKGLVLTFIVPGFLAYLGYEVFKRIEDIIIPVMCYTLSSFPDRGLSPAFLLYREELLKKYEGSISIDVLAKISEKES